MSKKPHLAALVLAILPAFFVFTVPGNAKTYRPPSDIIDTSKPEEWQPLDPATTLVMTVHGQQLVIALAPRFAPQHVANILALTHEGYWNGVDIVRVQDNYVVQWADPNADDKAKAKPLGAAKPHLPAEYSIPLKGLDITRIADPDGWAPVTGFADNMPVAADPAKDQAWITHCYGIVGAGRDNPPDSSTGAELYAVIGQSPRNLDLNITVVGRVVKGIEVLSSLPRGTGKLGFYDKPEQNIPIESLRLLGRYPGCGPTGARNHADRQRLVQGTARIPAPRDQPVVRAQLGIQQCVQRLDPGARDRGEALLI